MNLRLLSSFLLLVAPTLPAAQTQVTLGASKDNTLYESGGQVSNGAGDHFFAGRTNTNLRRRGLVRFDVSSIPPGSTITAVSLRLVVSRTRAQTKNINLHLVLQDWGEGTSHAGGEEGGGAPPTTGDATWINRFYPGTAWSTPGGAFAGTASATTPVNQEGPYTWSSAQMIADVQAWVNSPATNFGWVLVGEENGTKTAKRFDSRTNANTGNRPRLTITFTSPVAVGGCCFADGTCLVTSSATCASQGGTYQGDSTSCSPNPCPQPTGACCLSSGACITTTAASCAAQGGVYNGNGVSCASVFCPFALTPFVDPLPIPAVAVPTVGTSGGAAEYTIAARQLQQQLHRDLPPTTVWGYAGTFPGPTIEAAVDQPVRVNWVNDLRDGMGNLRTDHFLPVDLCLHGPDMAGATPRTVVHLHGAHVETASDGYPEDTTLPGETNVYDYPNHQLPATLWYHDHALGITRLNVMMGLAGFYLIRDAFEQALGLPSGTNEIPLVIQDRSFLSDGSLEYPPDWHEHFFGDTILVNGKVWPYLEVKRGKYRFRVLNGSNSRTYGLSLSNGAYFWQIGTDGGLLPAPVPMTHIVLQPGERADLVFNFEPYTAGIELELQNDAPAPYPGTPGVGVIPDVMKFVVTGTVGHTAPLPTSLRPIEVLSEADAHEHRAFELRKYSHPCTGDTWLINGLEWHDVTEFPVLGDTEVWSFVNRSGISHPMHPHLVQAQLLDRQAFTLVGDEVVPSGPVIPPAPGEAGWKDTFECPPGQITRVIMRFEDYTGLYPYHCHILEHEDHEMMRQFRVTPARTRRSDPPPGPVIDW